MADNDPQTPKELSVFADSILKGIQERFQIVSEQLTQKMDDMGSNIDELQNDVNALMSQAGIENTEEVSH